MPDDVDSSPMMQIKEDDSDGIGDERIWAKFYGGNWNGSDLQCETAMATMILTVTPTTKVEENIEKTGLQIAHQKIQSSDSDIMLEILNEQYCISQVIKYT